MSICLCQKVNGFSPDTDTATVTATVTATDTATKIQRYKDTKILKILYLPMRERDILQV